LPPLKGADKIQRRLQALAKNMPKEILQAATIEAELVKTDSQKNYVPVDLGTLRGSATVTSKIEGGVISISIAYGGAAAPYALAIHEHLSSHSPPSWKKAQSVTFHPSGRGPKYLERPLFAAKPKMAEKIAERIEKKVKKIVESGAP